MPYFLLNHNRKRSSHPFLPWDKDHRQKYGRLSVTIYVSLLTPWILLRTPTGPVGALKPPDHARWAQTMDGTFGI